MPYGHGCCGGGESLRNDRRHACAAHAADHFQALVSVVVGVRDDEALLVLQLLESGGDRLGDEFVDCVDRGEPLAHVECAELDAVARHGRPRRHRLGIDEDPVSGERRVNVAQGVHDALEGHSSQGPAAEGDVETLSRKVERLGVADREADAATLLARQRRTRGRNTLGARIEAVHRGCARGGEHGEPPLAAADFENAFAFERNQCGDRRCLDPVFVAPLHPLGLVRLDGGASGAELLRLTARVFELGAGVGVDELAGLDPLESVTL